MVALSLPNDRYAGHPPEAIEVFLSDERAVGWLPDTMRESYLDVKRTEQSLAAAESDEDNATRYRRAY